MSAFAYGIGEHLEHALCMFKVHTCVGDALAVGTVVGVVVLATGDQVAFEHNTHDVVGASGQLIGDSLCDGGLLCVVFVAIAVATVDHDACGCAVPLFEFFDGGFDAGLVVVGAAR